MEAIPLPDMLIRIGLSLVFGGIIGFDRERVSQPAGLRTHMILVVGACLAMILSINIAFEGGSDPTRIAAQVVSGIGFLGAGAILRSGFNVKGLTTATTMWTMAIVGMAVGAGYYAVSAITTIVLIIVLSLVDVFEKRFVRINIIRNFVVDINERKGALLEVRKTMSEIAEQVISFSVKKSVKEKHLRIEVAARFNRDESVEHLLEQISEIDGIRSIKIQ